ncbi:MAG: phage terminase large subunit [Candidatus Kapabacteria bacterium]|nr:phage terminase large subunit [Candidatus Kapabacteria bacterium]
MLHLDKIMQISDVSIRLLAEIFKDDFYSFLRYYWDTIEDSPLVDNWHIKYLCDEIQTAVKRVAEGKPKLYDLCINVPPGSTKSRICSIYLPVWAWTLRPSMRVLTASYSANLAVDFALKSRDILRSDLFRAMYPDLVLRLDRDTKAEYENNHFGVRTATGIYGTITGKHADIIVGDDPISAEEVHSTAKRNKANRVLSQTLPRRKRNNDVTLTILVMQRLHADDPTAQMLKRPNVKHICLPGELTEDVKPAELRSHYVDGLFDPVRMNRIALNDIRDEMGSYGYSAQIKQNPVDPESMIFNPAWWGRFKIAPPLDLVIQVWDTAYEEGENNAYSVCLTGGVNINGFYILDRFKRRLLYPDLLKEAKVQYVKHDPTYIAIEKAASGRSLIQSLKRETKLPIKEVGTMDKVVRAHQQSPKVERGLVFLPDGADWLDDFISEHAEFPGSKFKDQVDTLTIMLQRLEPHFRALQANTNKVSTRQLTNYRQEESIYQGQL